MPNRSVELRGNCLHKLGSMRDRWDVSLLGGSHRQSAPPGASKDWSPANMPSSRYWASTQSWNKCLHWNCQWTKEPEEKVKNTLGLKLCMNLTRLQSDTEWYCEEKTLLFHSIDVNDSNNLEYCNDEQRHRAHIAVKDLHPVVPRTHSEDESRQERYQADDPWVTK